MGTFRFILLFRGLAALWVCLAHVQFWSGRTYLPLREPVIAVELFMLISGFLMVATTSGVESPQGRMAFWTRRFFRIAPAYYVSLALAVVGASWFLGGYALLYDTSDRWISEFFDASRVQYDPLNLLLHVSFVFGLFPEYSFSTMLPDWSLSLEMQFYFFFPFLLLFLRRFGAPALGLLAIPVYLVGAWFGNGAGYVQPSMLAIYLHVFVAGMLLHDALNASGSRKVGTIALAVFLASLAGDLTAYLLLGMFALGELEKGDDPLAWLTSSRLVRFASDVSYGVYLFHGFWIAACGFWLSREVMLPVVLVGSYLTGWLCFRYIEQPGIALGKKLSRRRRTSPTASESARSQPDTTA